VIPESLTVVHRRLREALPDAIERLTQCGGRTHRVNLPHGDPYLMVMNDNIADQAVVVGRQLQAAAIAEQTELAAMGTPLGDRMRDWLTAHRRVPRAGSTRRAPGWCSDEGNSEAPLMLIGEGPGQNEDARAARSWTCRTLLDDCLRENGILRKHIYVCKRHTL